MSTTPAFNTQVIGQTENALGALMNRVLARAGGTFRQWVALNLTAVSGGVIDRDQLVSRMTGALKIDDSAVLAAIAELTAAQLLVDLPARGSASGSRTRAKRATARSAAPSTRSPNGSTATSPLTT
jgi:hypothetical protein